MPKKTNAQHARDLNKLSLPARDADLGGCVRDLIAQYNALLADHTALRASNAILLAKLDADAGVTDTTYVSLASPAAATAAAVTAMTDRS